MPHKRLENGFLADVMFITKLSESINLSQVVKQWLSKGLFMDALRSEIAFHAYIYFWLT